MIPTTLVEMLKYRRPAFSQTEEQFIETFLYPLGVRRDVFGNIIKQVGDSNVLWSCHTDTVHRLEGPQHVVIDGNIARLREDASSNCLGADCTTGVWMMREMILAEKPGLYIFHRAEEIGGQGSDYIRDHTPELLDGVDIAIAFDRYGTNSIITHQFGGRCCSDRFAKSLGDQLHGFTPDDGGSFTDTANYTELVSECSNISVGYMNQHTPRETQNLTFAPYLLGKILALDVSKLVVARDPAVPVRSAPTRYTMPFESTCKLIKNNPEAIANMLALYGISHDEVVEHIFAENGTLQGEYW